MSDTKSFEDIVRELAADLEAAVEAQVEPVLHPHKPGHGLQSVRERIEAAFAKAKTSGPTSLVSPKPVVPNDGLRTRQSAATSVQPAARPRRPLSEIAIPVLRVAEKHFAKTGIRHPQHQDVYFVVAPRKSANELCEEALACLPDTPETEAKIEIIEEEEAVQSPNQMHKTDKGGR
jgi:hypothetical protein